MSGLTMPKADEATMSRRPEIVAALRAIVPGEGVVDVTNEMRAFETDALTAYRQLPLVVVLPQTVLQVSRVLKYCHENNVKVVPRGSGTSLSGGALPLEDAVLLVMSRFNRILEIDYPNRAAVVQPGVTNLGITRAVEHEGFYYAPDPSSQIACSIGGNVAENSGGVHCLKYGLTANNVLGLEIVLITGEVVRLGGKHLDSEGYDLLGLMTGSEGLLGVVTEVTVRILQKPATARALMMGFPTSEEAGRCVADVIAAGIIPGGMEMMDRPAIHAAEDFVHAGYPLDVEALLIVELDGPAVEVDHLINMVEAIGRTNGATTCVVSQSEEERMAFWAGRKAAFPAVGRISPDYLCMDGTIPRKELPKVLAGMRELSEKYGLRVANVFHAGDGNLHPLILYDANIPEELHKAEDFGADILRLCVKVGGVLTGEHGVGVEKRDLMPEMFNEADLNQQIRVKCAFDDKHLLNPGKVFPQLHRCAELGRMHVHRGQLPFSDIPKILSVTTFTPTTENEIVEAVQWALAEQAPVEIMGFGSKRGLGRPLQTEHTITLSGYAGVTLYEPDELVLSARAGTPVAELETLIAENGQAFQFEPMDYGPLLGQPAGQGSLGGLLATNLCGPRRLKAGSARDHVLGVRVVSGRGELFKSGGRVVKNVTGYDLSKGMANSWGTLGIATEITFKVLPAPETETTLVIRGLADDEAARAMAIAMGSSGEVAAAAHLPGNVAGRVIDGALNGVSSTLLRLEGFAPSVSDRAGMLKTLLATAGTIDAIPQDISRRLWREVRDVIPFADATDRPVWRVSMVPMEAYKLVASLRMGAAVDAYYDWQGGLVWLRMEGDPEAEAVRALVRKYGGGHATLVRAPAGVRAALPVFEPQPRPLAALSERLKQQFDPSGILNPGRMVAGV